MSLLGVATAALDAVATYGSRGCLVGGLAVSVRCDPRFTRDVDLVVVVADDRDAEQLIHSLTAGDWRVALLEEQEAADRLAMVGITDPQGCSVDLLLASSGIEAEIASSAELLDVTPMKRIPVARVGHLIAMKLLSVGEGRETDWADLRSLAGIADAHEWSIASEAVELILSRGTPEIEIWSPTFANCDGGAPSASRRDVEVAGPPHGGHGEPRGSSHRARRNHLRDIIRGHLAPRTPCACSGSRARERYRRLPADGHPGYPPLRAASDREPDCCGP